VGWHTANSAFSGWHIKFLGQSQPVPAGPAVGESRLGRRQAIPAGPDRLPPAWASFLVQQRTRLGRLSSSPPGPTRDGSRLGRRALVLIWAGARQVLVLFGWASVGRNPGWPAFSQFPAGPVISHFHRGQLLIHSRRGLASPQLPAGLASGFPAWAGAGILVELILVGPRPPLADRWQRGC
jgi:hypothetical protein